MLPPCTFCKHFLLLKVSALHIVVLYLGKLGYTWVGVVVPWLRCVSYLQLVDWCFFVCIVYININIFCGYRGIPACHWLRDTGCGISCLLRLHTCQSLSISPSWWEREGLIFVSKWWWRWQHYLPTEQLESMTALPIPERIASGLGLWARPLGSDWQTGPVWRRVQ